MGIAVVVPPAVGSTLLAGGDDGDGASPLVYVFLLVILVGFGAAGFRAASQPEAAAAPVQHGALAGAAAFVAVQAVGAVLVLARGDSLAPLSMVASLLLAASCGAVGGLVASRPTADSRSQP